MSQIILVTSFKGGVGKTTVSASIAIRLAQTGNRVLVCDCDLESRCLDIVLGIENQPLFNICDAVTGKCDVSSAIVPDERFEGLYFMPAPAFYPEAFQTEDTSDMFSEENVNRFLGGISSDYDYIIFDLPARPDMLYRRLIRHSDTVLVVSLHTATSIRAAEKTAIAIRELCDEKKVPDVKLIVNGFKATDVKNGDNIGLYEIIGKTGLALAGVIPFDSEMVRAQELGEPVSLYKKGKLPFWKAICNTCRRLEGANVKLLDGIKIGVSKFRIC